MLHDISKFVEISKDPDLTRYMEDVHAWFGRPFSKTVGTYLEPQVMMVLCENSYCHITFDTCEQIRGLSSRLMYSLTKPVISYLHLLAESKKQDGGHISRFVPIMLSPCSRDLEGPDPFWSYINSSLNELTELRHLQRDTMINLAQSGQLFFIIATELMTNQTATLVREISIAFPLCRVLLISTNKQWSAEAKKAYYQTISQITRVNVMKDDDGCPVFVSTTY